MFFKYTNILLLSLNYLSLTNFVMLYTYLKKIKDADEKKRTIEHLIQLRRQLDDEIPGKTAEGTLLLATWNIRQFTDNRRPESYMYIAEILSRFDLVAIQEVKEQMKGLEEVMKILGKNWAFIATPKARKGTGNALPSSTTPTRSASRISPEK